MAQTTYTDHRQAGNTELFFLLVMSPESPGVAATESCAIVVAVAAPYTK